MERKNFTMKELAMCICALMLLTATGLPLLRAAQGAGQETLCMEQLKKVAAAHQNYLKDNKGFFVPYQGASKSKTTPSSGIFSGRALKYRKVNGNYQNTEKFSGDFCKSAFVPIVMGYMQGDFSPLYCPADQRPTLQPCYYADSNSYAYVFSVLGKGQSREFNFMDTPQLDDLPDPAEQILYGESASGRGVIDGKITGKGWMFFQNTADKGKAHAPHQNVYNFVFVDGHAATWSYEDVLKKHQFFDSNL